MVSASANTAQVLAVTGLADPVEDALAGVAADRAGEFGYVVGADRAGRAAAPREQGADVVVRDLAELLEAPVDR